MTKEGGVVSKLYLSGQDHSFGLYHLPSVVSGDPDSLGRAALAMTSRGAKKLYVNSIPTSTRLISEDPNIGSAAEAYKKAYKGLKDSSRYSVDMSSVMGDGVPDIREKTQGRNPRITSKTLSMFTEEVIVKERSIVDPSRIGKKRRTDIVNYQNKKPGRRK